MKHVHISYSAAKPNIGNRRVHKVNGIEGNDGSEDNLEALEII